MEENNEIINLEKGNHLNDPMRKEIELVKHIHGAGISIHRESDYEEYSTPDPIDESSPFYYKPQPKLTIDDFCKQQHIDRSSPAYYKGKDYTREEIEEIIAKIEKRSAATIVVGLSPKEQEFLENGEMPECPDLETLIKATDEVLVPTDLEFLARILTKKLRKKYPIQTSSGPYKNLTITLSDYLCINNAHTFITRKSCINLMKTLTDMVGTKRAQRFLLAIVMRQVEELIFTNGNL